MDDVAVAGTPIARVSLDSLAVGGSLRLFVRIPDSTQWRRIRTAWGDHGYVVFATDPARRSLIPFGTLKLELALPRRRGAAHRFDAGEVQPPVPQRIDRIPGDPDANLWWVVKHGIRMTGMPSWDGILSDQEIWQVVAFVNCSGKHC